jgi:diguanylate cyclase (GGDEF)-like protein/PAS domain S-box-containing protein
MKEVVASMARPGPEPAILRLAQQWARAVRRIGFHPMSGSELETLLRGYTRELAESLRAERFDERAATEVGAGLVAAGLTDAGVLRASLGVLGEPLNRAASALKRGRRRPNRAARAERLAAVQAAMAAGYAAALRERTLVEQERLGRAVLVAHAETERALLESETRFRALFAGAAIGIGIADVDGHIIQANPALARLLGYNVAELHLRNVQDFIHPDDFPGMWDQYDEMIRGVREHVRMEKAYFRKDGTVVWTDLTVSLLRDDFGTPRYTVAMMEDITDRHQLQERLRYQALHDPLTGLPNRTLFADRLAEAFDAAAPGTHIGLCYLDLDGFKRINDSLGHEVGDRLLVAIARRLHRRASAHGHLVARMGGDEFVILSEKAEQDDLVSLAEEVLASLELPVRAGPHGLRVSASIGIVALPVEATGPAEILKAADLTLYRAKAAGRGRWARYDADLSAAQLARYALAEALPTAVQRGEFALLYQPLVELPTGLACGVEALLRWHHPELGTLTPDKFIDLAEESGAIGAIGGWVLREACKQAATWRAECPDRPFYVSVNIAAAQTYDPALVSDVLATLDESGLPPTMLQLELTESAMLAGAGAPLEALETLAAAGIRLAIDDFGTGYSNLAYLRTLPVTALKLDRQFTDGLRGPNAAVDTHIMVTLIQLAHLLDLAVTAEGVETAEQLERLKELGCDAAQGWYLALPQEADEVVKVLRRDRCPKLDELE